MIGHQYAVERLLRDLVVYLDTTKCFTKTCDWAAIGNLYIYDRYYIERDNHMEIVGKWPGEGAINTKATGRDSIESLKYLKNGEVLDDNFQISPLVINLEASEMLHQKVTWKARNYAAETGPNVLKIVK